MSTYPRSYDELLHGGRRWLRTLPKSMLLGPTGARLWVDCLDPVPGFSGTIDYVHKSNIPGAFSVSCSACTEYDNATVDWYPSRMKVELETPRISFREVKFVTWDDCLVSSQYWRNNTNDPITLSINLPKAGKRSASNANGLPFGTHMYFDKPPRPIHVEIAATGRWRGDMCTVEPGATLEFALVAAFGFENDPNAIELTRRATCRLEDGQSHADLEADQVKQYESWFDATPSFTSSNVTIDKTWAYRWFLLRHNLAHPGIGYLKHPLFFEGRSHKMSKTPFAPDGWEFSKLIPLSVPLHLLDARWHHDASPAIGALKNLISTQDADGLYHCAYVDRTLAAYANFVGWASYQLYLATGEHEILEEILPSLKRQIRGWRTVYSTEHDRLLVDHIHQLTGKEYQPSFWFFSGFPDDCKDPRHITPLKRVDRAIYYYLNALGVAELCAIANDGDEAEFRTLADGISEDVQTLMWDSATSFFYDLSSETNTKAMVKNIVGVYPYWAGIADAEQLRGFETLFSPEFATPCAFPSVSTECPAFQPSGGWKGIFIKGRNGCVWDGPTWPYTNSIVLDAIGTVSKRFGHRYDAKFAEFFREFTLLHFSGRDISRPYLVEHYDSMTAEALSDEPDYNHSYYVDLVVRHVAGLNPMINGIVLDPVDIGLDYFDLDNVRLCGRHLRITYCRAGSVEAAEGLPTGYVLFVDGVEVRKSGKLERLEYEYPDS